MQVVDVLLPDHGARIFSYRCETDEHFGRFVTVPLAARQRCLGLVVSHPYVPAEQYEYRPIAEALSVPFRLSEQRLSTARYIADRCFCRLGEAIALFLPEDPTSYRATEPSYRLCDDAGLLQSIRSNETAKRRVIACLQEHGSMQRLDLQRSVHVTKSVLVAMEEAGYIISCSNEPAAQETCAPNTLRPLTGEQQRVKESLQNLDDALLYGVTGSGKTEVYLELIADALASGRRALFLLPEISLTPQMTMRVRRRFSDHRVAVVHSKISTLERNTLHRDIAAGSYDIVIGARSALFVPLDDIGVIVVDECHERSFCSDKRPRYDAIDVARFLAGQHGARLILGSATPDVAMVYRYRASNALVSLTARYNDYDVPQPTTVDLRRERDKIISSSLDRAILDRLRRGEQTILFLNKKGYSGLVLCGACGFQHRCPHCDISLTYYREEQRLRCGYCGHSEPVVERCPSCDSDAFGYLGLGTERIEAIVRERYPEARVERLDRSVVTSHARLQEILERMERGDIDILIGTQIIAKGFDFPKVTLVGILLADLQLRQPSYLASERAFQLFTQVAGRAGRSGLRSEVLLQTFHPEHYALRAPTFDAFYEQEIAFRRDLSYPPFRELYQLIFSDEDEAKAHQSAVRSRSYIARSIEKINLQNEVTILQVLPANLRKRAGQYRFQVLIMAKEEHDEAVRAILSRIEGKLSRTKLATITIDIGAKG